MNITLYGSDGGVYSAQLTRDSEIAWTHTFTGMPDCSYSLEAVCPANYNMKIDQDTLTVHNTLRVSAKPEETTEPAESDETEETTEPAEDDETEETTEPEEGAETEEITEPEAEPQAPDIRATISSTRRPVMNPGETVVLTAKVEGAEGYETMLQWQCDKGNGFEDVPGANGETLSFEASVETLAYSWRVAVYYR
ncbi:MAG: Cna B-type domain-containing protein [Clostridiales bacterium]|nr:Cna B-type domain-containing protein [Clostridiales bacterium]